MPLEREFIRELRRRLSDDEVLAGPEACVAFECDALTMHRRMPDLVLLPRDSEGVRAIMQAAHR